MCQDPTESIGSIHSVSNILDQSPIMVWRSGREGRFDWFNASWLAFTGRTLTQERNQGWTEGVHPDDVDRSRAEYREAFLDRRLIELEFRLRHNHGEYRWILAAGTPFYSTEGKFSGYYGYCHDITDRRRTEEVARESDAMFRGLLTAAPVGIGLLQDRAFKWVNDQMLVMVGYWPGELIDQNARILYESDEEYDRVGRKKYEQIRKWGTGEADTRWKTKSGEIIDVHLRSTCIDAENFSKGIIFTALDITDRKRAKKTLQNTLEKLKHSQARLVQSEKMYAVGTLIAGVAHELNNPLTGILNFADCGIRFTSEADQNISVLQDISRETRRCIDIVQNLLTFSHSHSDRSTDPIVRAVRCAEVFDRVHRLLSHRIQRDQVRIEVAVEEDVPVIHTQVDALQQVLLNVASNALDALKGRPEKTIHVHIAPQDLGLEIAIRDSGCGIPEDHLQKIFDPFFTTKTAGEGTGLGLAITYNLVKDLDGEITCESKVNEGTVFRIALPQSIKNQPHSLNELLTIK